MKDVIC